ncbi:MAG: sugar nucleotide-binding protein [Candidatus Poribacteria bacterium]|nr:sugar nucleotide-binding protein [Candidatus Poribacteria bacterium]
MDKYLVVGRGLVGSIFSEDSRFVVVSHDEWHNRNLDSYSGMVCAAAISTETECQKARMAEVLEANVELPLRMLKLAKARDIPFVAFSTAGVYREAGVRKEDDDVSPHNRYTASKIMMEYALQNEVYQKLFVFRIPFVVLFNNHPNDLSARVQNWTQCEDVNASVVYRADIEHSVRSVMEKSPDGGIYNIATGIVHFPSFLSDRFGWRGDVVPAHSMGRTPNSQLDTTKSQQKGVL